MKKTIINHNKPFPGLGLMIALIIKETSPIRQKDVIYHGAAVIVIIYSQFLPARS